MGNLLDNIIEVVAPSWGYERAARRMALTTLRGYEAGGWGKRQSRIDRTNRSAAVEVMDGMGKVRGFSRELERNEPLVKKAIGTLTDNIIGQTGLLPTFYSESKIAQKKISKLFNAWASTTECDFEGINTFAGLQSLACAATHRDGEVLIRRVWDKKGKTVPMKLQILEADFLDETKTMQLDSGWITQGVEFDMRGRRVAYWLFESHPFDFTLYSTPLSVRVPAEDVAHIFMQDRPGQVRGIPTGVQAFMRVKDLAEYEDAELVRKKIAACFTAFITTSDTNPINVEEARRSKRMEPGTVHYLAQGDEVELTAPPTDHGYGDYIMTQERKIAMAYGLSYEALSGNLSNVNFSSGRMGWIEMGRNCGKWQYRVFMPMMLDRAFGWFMEAAMLAGHGSDNVTVAWTPPRREMLDPSKEFAAMEIAIRAGLMSWQEAVRETGWNIDQLIDELTKDRDMWDTLRLKPTCDPRFDKEPKAAKAAA